MRRLVGTAVALIACAAAMHAVTIVPASTRAFDAANDAWERGDYVAALNG